MFDFSSIASLFSDPQKQQLASQYLAQYGDPQRYATIAGVKPNSMPLHLGGQMGMGDMQKMATISGLLGQVMKSQEEQPMPFMQLPPPQMLGTGPYRNYMDLMF